MQTVIRAPLLMIAVVALLVAACSSGANTSSARGHRRQANPLARPRERPHSLREAMAPRHRDNRLSKPPAPAGFSSVPPVKVRMAMLAAVSDGGIFLAAERGHLREEGLEVEFTVIDSAGRMIPLLATRPVRHRHGRVKRRIDQCGAARRAREDRGRQGQSATGLRLRTARGSQGSRGRWGCRGRG